MARNRKRAKERRSRRPAAGQISRPGVATARAERDQTPSPIEHATPDVELADAQLALGRPELAGQPEAGEPERDDFDTYDDGELDDDGELEGPAGGGEGDGDGSGAIDIGGSGGRGGSGGGELAASGAPAPARRRVPGNRLINFLQGSWRELQRVQWPDRRQVMQATGVVIGFVIVAGVFLGVADTIATKIVNLILK